MTFLGNWGHLRSARHASETFLLLLVLRMEKDAATASWGPALALGMVLVMVVMITQVVLARVLVLALGARV